MVVLEAMAAGLPLISTPIGAIPDAVRDGEEGIIVPPRDAAALAAALKRLLEDPALRQRMGERGRRRVEEVYSRDVVVGQLETLYRRLLAS
jgi:glycosyltransferase involved in cell wall biosynthesis